MLLAHCIEAPYESFPGILLAGTRLDEEAENVEVVITRIVLLPCWFTNDSGFTRSDTAKS
jgi:hypothetical protein